MNGIVIDPNHTASLLLLPLLAGAMSASLFGYVVAKSNPRWSFGGFVGAGLLTSLALACALLLRYGTTPVVLPVQVDPSGRYEVQAIIMHHGADYQERGYVTLVDKKNDQVLKSEYCGLADFSVFWNDQSVLVTCRELSGGMKNFEWAIP